jgi:hypothetical protein
MNAGFRVKYPLFLFYCNETWIILTDLKKKILKYKISWKPIEWEPSFSMQADGEMDIHDEANSCFSQFCEHTNNCLYWLPWRVQVNDTVSCGLVVKVLLNNYRSKKYVQPRICISINELLNIQVKSGRLKYILVQ